MTDLTAKQKKLSAQPANVGVQRHQALKPHSVTKLDSDEFSTAATVEDRICEAIYSAILEQRLPSGTKLSEAALCEAFNTGRQRIRRVLLMLSSREVIQLHANRGAFVAEPSAEEARSIFEARRTIEPTIIRNVCRFSTKDDIVHLKRLFQREKLERINGNRHQAIRLSGEFHTSLAGMGRNQVFERIVNQLVARTSLIIGLYGKRDQFHCAEDEHEELLHAIAERDQDKASALMLNHIHHIEHELDLSRRDKPKINLTKLFS